MSYNPFERGAFPVGVRTLTMRDDARGGRELTVEVWYPAADSFRGWDLDETAGDTYTIAPGLPEMRQQAVRDAGPADGRFPLIVHCHGANGDRRDKTFLCTHLASHGYVIASPNFPGDTIADMVRDEQAGTGQRSTMSIDDLADDRPVRRGVRPGADARGCDPALAGRIDVGQRRRLRTLLRRLDEPGAQLGQSPPTRDVCDGAAVGMAQPDPAAASRRPAAPV